MADLPTGTVTLLFTDIEGSTRLHQQLGDQYVSLLAKCRHLLRAAFLEFHGHEVDTQGDAFFVAFAHATDAVSAAVAVQRTLFTHDWPEGVTVRVRIGLHTGEPSVSAEGYVGLDVHRAARIMSAGHGGQVLLSKTTRDLVEHILPEGVSLLDVGVHRLKDLQQPSQLFQLVMTGCQTSFPPLKTLDTQPNNLPGQPTPFLGRDQEVAAVAALLCREDVRLVTLTGPGGIGKTRLGLQVAAELSEVFPDGVFFVNLAPVSDPAFVLPAIALVLDVKELGGCALLDLLQAFLREKQVLLLLDNFEQVVQAAVLVAALLAACPKLKIMVTSRMRLHVRAEQEFAVPPLALPDPTRLPDLVALTQNEAVALFIQRAQAVKSDFQMNQSTAPAVAEICVRLDGLPLAIELAAARIKLLPPQALLARLGQRLAVLTGGARDVPDRQQNLRKTIDWSYDLLEEDEKSLFRRLAVFVGGCTLEAAEAVCNANRDLEEDVLDGIERLVDKSLLRQEAEIDGKPRLLMLGTIREYALERLEASGEAETLRRQHAIFFLAMAEETELNLRSTEQSTWRRRLEAEHDNLRAALRWTLEHQEAEMGLRLVGALLIFWRYCNHPREGRRWCEQVLAQPGARARTAVRACALRAAGAMAFFQDDFSEAQRLLEESVSIGREVGAEGKRDLAHALELLGNVALLQGDPGEARQLAGESLQVYQELGEAWGIAMALCQLGRAAGELDDPVTACSLLEESAARLRLVGDRQRLALPLNALGLVALGRGDYAAAHARFKEALAVAQETEDAQYIADALAHLGTVAFRMGEYHESLSYYQQSLALNWEQGTRGHTLIEPLAGLAALASLFGQLERAVRQLGAVEALREASNIRLSPVHRAEYDRAMEGIRAQVDAATFAEAWKEGQTTPLDAVLAAQESILGAAPLSSEQPSPAPTKSVPRYPHGLTQREFDVLRLLAQGMTDAQIAEQLIISPRTVNTHLTHIFNELGVNSRAAAAAFAIRQKLVE